MANAHAGPVSFEGLSLPQHFVVVRDEVTTVYMVTTSTSLNMGPFVELIFKALGVPDPDMLCQSRIGSFHAIYILVRVP